MLCMTVSLLLLNSEPGTSGVGHLFNVSTMLSAYVGMPGQTYDLGGQHAFSLQE